MLERRTTPLPLLLVITIAIVTVGCFPAMGPDPTPDPDPAVEPVVSDWYVDDDADPGVADGSLGAPFATIEEALAVATSGQIIAVAGGTYNSTETITVSEAVSILGSFDSSFLTQTLTPTPTTLIRSTADVALLIDPSGAISRTTVFEGLDVETDQSGTFRAALRINGAAAPTVKRSRFATPNGGWAVYVPTSGDPRIEGSYLVGMIDQDYSQARALYVQDTASVELVGNTVIGSLAPSNTGYGIGVDFQSGGDFLAINNLFWSGTID